MLKYISIGEITLILNLRNNNIYIQVNEFIKFIYNPRRPSSYWGHLVTKYKKKNVDLSKYIKILNIRCKDKRKHLSRILLLKDSILLEQIFNSDKFKLFILQNKTKILKLKYQILIDYYTEKLNKL